MLKIKRGKVNSEEVALQITKARIDFLENGMGTTCME